MTTTGALAPSGVRAALMSRLPANQLGERLRALRDALGLSQRQVAAIAECNKSYYAALERGKVQLPDRERLHSLAQALRTDAFDLLHAAGYIVQPDVLVGIDGRLLAAARGAPADVQEAAARMIETTKRVNGDG